MRIGVIGTGLFGSIVARHLTELGHQVTTIDSRDPHAGSGPAACLIKPSWLNSLEKPQIEASFSLLDRYYGVTDIPFTVNGGLTSVVRWVNPARILRSPDYPAQVASVTYSAVQDGWAVNFAGQPPAAPPTLHFDGIVVAAGYWSFSLLGMKDQMVGQAGCAHLYDGQIEKPFIKVWAPYKQLVGFNRDPDHIWIGDGAAIKRENWNEDHRVKNRIRCDSSRPGPAPHFRSMFGIRPYVKDAKPCYINEVQDGLWVVTGGAKNGTIAAGWAAHFVGENMR